MSQEEARRFIERIDTDDAFRKEVLAAPDVAERLRLAAAEGYDITVGDLEGASRELTDAELGHVAGGSEMQGVDGETGEGERGTMPSCCCYSIWDS